MGTRFALFLVRRQTLEDLTGRVLNNRYLIERFVGSGGMAEVYKAKDVDAPHYYAIKVIREQLLEHPSLVTRFEEEAERLKNLQHPNIVRFYDFITSDNLTYIVMEYVEGYPLSRMLRLRRQRNEGPMPVEEAVRVLTQVSRALARVHDQGLVHRDVKPGNILIRKTDGAAFLTDLGIAKDLTHGAVTQTLVGTFAYLAPEQIMRQPVSPSTDIYALGTVAYYMLTGCRPFEAPRGAEFDTAQLEQILIDQHLNKLPVPLSAHNPYLPPALDAAIGRALSKIPEARYPDAMAFMRNVHEALRALLPGDMQVLQEIDATPIRIQENARPSPSSPPPAHTGPARSKFIERRKRERRIAAIAMLTIIAIILSLAGLVALNRSVAPPTGTPTPNTPSATPSPLPNLTVTSDWLTLQAERQALSETETALALLLVPTSTATPTMSPSETPSATPTATATTTPSATATATNTPTPSPTTTNTATVTPSPTQLNPYAALAQLVQSANTALAPTLRALTGTPTTKATAVLAISPPPSRLPSVTPTPSVTSSSTSTSTPSTTSTPTLTPTRTATPTPSATPTSAVVAWCERAEILQEAIGFNEIEVDGELELEVNEEAIQQYLVERESAPNDPDTGQLPECMSVIDEWLYENLIKATKLYFSESYKQLVSRPADSVTERTLARARRYLNYATNIAPDSAATPTLRQCVMLLDQIENPIAMRDQIRALRAQDADLSICEPTLTIMWDAAIEVFPEIENRPLAQVIERTYLYDIPGANQIILLDPDEPVAVLGRTKAISGDYWLLVSLENGQRGYLKRQAANWETISEFDAVPTVIPPPLPP